MSGRFLIIDDEAELLELVSMLIEEEIPKSEILTSSSGNKAIELLRADQRFDAILCDYNMVDGTGGDVYFYLVQSQLKIPFILISGGFINDYPEFQNFESNSKSNLFLAKPFNENLLINHLLSLLKVESALDEKKEENPQGPFIKVPISIIEEHLDICPECFIKIGNDKWLSAIKPGSNHVEQFLLFKQKGTDFFYFDCDKFKTFFRNVYLKSQQRSQSELNLFESNGFSLRNDVAEKMSISPITKKNIDEIIDEVLHEFEESEAQFDKFSNAQESLNKHHLVLVSYLGFVLQRKCSWSNPKLLKSHIRAALLHDFFLKNEEFENELNRKDLDTELRTSTYYEHIQFASEASQKLWPDDSALETIIKQHHELPNRDGFPRQLSSADISAPSAVFILVHFLAMGMLRTQNFNKKQIHHLLMQHPEFNSGGYAQVYKMAQDLWGD